MKAVFGDEGFQVGFEVAGVESSIRPLMECAEKGGTIVVVAVFAKDPALSMFFLGEHELILAGTMMYRHEDYLTARRGNSLRQGHPRPARDRPLRLRTV